MNHDTLEFAAQLSAQRFLLEVVYANAFASNPDGLDRLMHELQRLARVAPVRSEPAPAEDEIEIQARIATHLQRFHAAVRHRVESGRAV